MKTPIGNCPTEPQKIAKFRKHQGWWRAFVLNEPEGEYLDQKNKLKKTVCSRFNGGKESKKNFLSLEIVDSVDLSIQDHHKNKKGIIDEERLYNNLLSSQPIAFNFFGWFSQHKEIALQFLKSLVSKVDELVEVVFEYAPGNSKDHSAFDFGFIVKASDKKGFIGFECKYTDTFSFKRSSTSNYYGDEGDQNYRDYFELYSKGKERLPDDYFSYIRDKNFNQLFRNEILTLQLEDEFDFVYTGLFCHHEDEETIDAGCQFQRKVGNRKSDFILLTYAEYIEKMQKLSLSWQERELVMMLWARYCGLQLSKELRT